MSVELHRLTLRDVLRFEGEVDLDLRSLPAGLIAIVGPNGEGKTSILEACIASIYRRLPSRGDRGLADVALSNRASVASEFAYAGHQYRARVTVDPARRTSEAVLSVGPGWAPDESEPVVINDGKVSTFDAAVAERFPPLELLLASSFAAQNGAGSFVRAKRKERKELFATLLGLEHYRVLEDVARKAEAVASAAAGVLDAQIVEVGAGLDVIGVIEDPARLRESCTAADQIVESEAAALAAAEQDLDELSVRLEQLSDVETRLAVNGAERERLDAEYTRARAEWAAEQEAADRDRERFHVEHTKSLEALSVTARVATEIIERDGGKAAAAIEGVPRLEKLVSENADAMNAAREATARAARVEAELDEAFRAAKQLEAVPCGGVGEYAACPLILDAVADRDAIGALQSRLAGCPVAEARDHEARVSERYGASVEALQRRRDLAATIGAVEGARATLAGIEAELSAAAGRKTSELAALDDRLSRADERTRKRLEEIGERRVAIDAEWASSERQRDEMGPAAEARAALEQRIDTLPGALSRAREEAADLGSRLRLAESLSKQREQLRDRHAALVGRRAVAAREAREWGLLVAALARDGLPTLEIATAGPSVSAVCNDLLESCFGSRFSVELVTEQPKRSGAGMLEVFELRIFDNARGGAARDLADLSGGEQIIVDEALKAAIGVFVNDRAPAPIATCFRDETTGPLDDDNARRYVAMLRRLLEAGRYRRIFYVSHHADAADLADAQIVVGGGAAEVALPPFDKA